MESSMALPWGRQPEAGCGESALADQISTRGSDCFARGSRIEVMWQVSEEEGESSTKWWGAELLSQSSAEDKSIWTIRYDACDSFDPEEATVRLMPTGHLERLEDCNAAEKILSWRREGDVSEDEEADELLNLQDIVAEQESIERQTGQSLDQVAMEHLQQNLDPSQQRAVVAGFRNFVDHFKSRLDQLVHSHDAPGDYVVTTSDVQNIVASLKK